MKNWLVNTFAIGLAVVLLTEVEVSHGNEQNQASSSASFERQGAVDTPATGVAEVTTWEGSVGLTSIKMTDSPDPAEQTYTLAFEAWFDGKPQRLAEGEYDIVNYDKAREGLAEGVSVTYIHILENKGSKYSNVAVEYDVSLGQVQPAGQLTITEVTETHMHGTFSVDLRYSGSINKGEMEGKQLQLINGEFVATLPAELRN
jgi:hypothetical protein